MYCTVLIISITRTTHAHDASQCAVPVRMCPLCMRIDHVELRCQKLVGAQERLRLNRTWKVSIIYTWLVKTLHHVLSSLICTFSSCPLSFYCKLTLSLLLSLSQCHQPLAAISTWLHKTHTLQRTSRVVLPMASSILGCQWTWRDAWVPLCACERKLTFLSVTDTYVCTLRE